MLMWCEIEHCADGDGVLACRGSAALYCIQLMHECVICVMVKLHPRGVRSTREGSANKFHQHWLVYRNTVRCPNAV